MRAGGVTIQPSIFHARLGSSFLRKKRLRSVKRRSGSPDSES